jgi:FkbM family methyltransferase
MSNLIARITNRLSCILLRAYLRPRHRLDLVKLGSAYGGWIVPTTLLKGSSVCYCVGVGEDITFDLALIERFGCQVFSFDPTPRAIQHVQSIASTIDNFRFYPVGLWSSEQRMKFFTPKNPLHVSHSIVNLQKTAEYFEADCKRLSTIMRELGHVGLDLLKLDIEGAEYEVLSSLMEDNIQVNVLCVEFDQPAPLSSIIGMVKQLQQAQYQLVSIDGWNFTFVNPRSYAF